MLEHARYAAEFVHSSDRQHFDHDREKQFAVVRALEIIGEAAKAVPAAVRDMSPSIPWKQITAMRDKLIHHYFGVDVEIVWESATQDMPSLIKELEILIAKLKAPNV